jgi:hypothetical protein
VYLGAHGFGAFRGLLFAGDGDFLTGDAVRRAGEGVFRRIVLGFTAVIYYYRLIFSQSIIKDEGYPDVP